MTKQKLKSGDLVVDLQGHIHIVETCKWSPSRISTLPPYKASHFIWRVTTTSREHTKFPGLYVYTIGQIKDFELVEKGFDRALL